MVKNSFMISRILNFFRLVGSFSAGSAILRIFINFKNGVKTISFNSKALRFMMRDGFVGENWDKTCFYAIIDNTLNLIPKLFMKAHDKLYNVLSASILYKIINMVSEHLFVYAGLAVALIFIAPHELWNNVYSLLIMVLLLCLFFAGALTGRFSGFKLKDIGFYAFVFMLFVILSFVFSQDISKSTRFFLFYLTAFLAMILPVGIVKTKQEFYGFIAPILLALAVGGLYGTYQSIVGVPLKWWQVDLIQNEGIPGRIFSLYDNPNNFAELIVMIFPFFMAVFFSAKNMFIKLGALACAIPLGVSMIYTLSRSGWIGLAICVFIFTVIIMPKAVPYLIAFGLLCVPLMPMSVYRRFLTIFISNDSSSQYRFTIIQTMWPILREKWFTGYGLGSDVLFDYANVYFKIIHTANIMLTKAVPVHCHNIYMQLWAETGIFGIISFLAFVGAFLKSAVKSAYSAVFDNELKPFAAAGFASIVSVLVIGFVEYIWYYPRIMVMFWLVIGITMTAVKIGKKAQ